MKRFIGRKYSDPSVQSDKRLMPYDIVSRDNDRPYISITVGSSGTTSFYAPEEISAMVLSKLKHDTEKYLGKEITSAVVTVPAFLMMPNVTRHVMPV